MSDDPVHHANDTESNVDRVQANQRSWLGCAVKTVLALVAIATTLLLTQHFLRPQIDPELTKSAEIKIGQQPVTPEVTEKSPPDANGKTPQESNSIAELISPEKIAVAEHPLDPLLEVAKKAVEHIDETIFDYTTVMESQVRIKGKLGEPKFLKLKIRHERKLENETKPFAVYTYFLKPVARAGQEAIWIEGQNDNKLCGHAHGLFNVIRVWLAPTNRLAMDGNLHPISEIGMRRLLLMMIAKGTRDRKHGDCEVNVFRNVTVNDRKCTMIEVIHAEQADHFDFHIAKIYLDDELSLPIAYEGFLWPKEAGGDPLLLERYFYTDIKLNVGLKDIDFDPDNPEYNYPRK